LTAVTQEGVLAQHHLVFVSLGFIEQCIGGLISDNGSRFFQSIQLRDILGLNCV